MAVRSSHTLLQSHSLAISLAGAIMGCASDPDAPIAHRVVDTKLACEERAKWSPNAATVCADCQAYAKVPACLCPASRDFGGACDTESSRMQSNPECTADVLACAEQCGKNCSCIDGCFSTHPACRSDHSALATCVLDTCTRYCQ